MNLKNPQSRSNLKTLCRTDSITPGCKLSNMSSVIPGFSEARTMNGTVDRRTADNNLCFVPCNLRHDLSPWDRGGTSSRPSTTGGHACYVQSTSWSMFEYFEGAANGAPNDECGDRSTGEAMNGALNEERHSRNFKPRGDFNGRKRLQ